MHRTVSDSLSLLLIISLTLSVSAQNFSSSSSSSGTHFVTGCHLPDKTVIPFCGDEVNYPISNNYNDTELDEDAQARTEVGGTRCPVFLQKSLQCQLHFPRCSISSTNQTLLALVCQSSCVQAGQNYDNRFCSRFNQNFPDECSFYPDFNPDLVGTDATTCVALNFSDDNSSQTWKIILVTILCVIGFLLLVSYAWGRYRQYRQKQLLEKEDDDDRQRELVRAQNIGNPSSSIPPPSPQIGSDFNNIQPNNLVQSDGVPYLHPTDPRRSSVGSGGGGQRNNNQGDGYATMVIMPGDK